jgi:hypothetical protein
MENSTDGTRWRRGRDSNPRYRLLVARIGDLASRASQCDDWLPMPQWIWRMGSGN